MTRRRVPLTALLLVTTLGAASALAADDPVKAGRDSMLHGVFPRDEY